MVNNQIKDLSDYKYKKLDRFFSKGVFIEKKGLYYRIKEHLFETVDSHENDNILIMLFRNKRVRQL